MIAFDSATDGGIQLGVTSLTWSHTCSGSDRVLVVFTEDTTGNDRVTGVTYNGVAMTQVQKAVNTNNSYLYTYVLFAPATGANNVVVSTSTSTNLCGGSVSYTGSANTLDANSTETKNSTTNPSWSLTTVSDNSWVVMATNQTGGPSTAGSNTTLRKDCGSGAMYIWESSLNPITPAGSTTINVTNASADYVCHKIAIKVSTGSPSPSLSPSSSTSLSPSLSPSSSASASQSPSSSISLSPSSSQSPSSSVSASPSVTGSPSPSASPSITPSSSPSLSPSLSASSSESRSPSLSASSSVSLSPSSSISSSISASPSRSISLSPSSSVSPSPSPAIYVEKYTIVGNIYTNKYRTW